MALSTAVIDPQILYHVFVHQNIDIKIDLRCVCFPNTLLSR